MKDPKTAWAWVGGVIVVVALATGIVWHFYGNATKEATSGPVAVHAPSGQLVAGFPQELVLDDAARVSDSYSVNYSSSTNQYTAEWTSSSTLASLYAKYQSYIATNGWTITNHADYPAYKNIFASNSAKNAGMNVIITSQGSGTKVSLTYVAK